MAKWSSVLVLILSARCATAGIIFNFTDGADLATLQTTDVTTYNNVRNGFQAAANIFSSRFSDNVTLNVEINYKSLGSGILGSTNNNTAGALYSNVRNALIADSTTSVDAIAVSNLQSTAGIDFVSRSNNTAVRSNLTDAWARVLDVSRSNLKALGLLAANDGGAGSEGRIEFSSNFTWDFDRTNGINGSAFDFVGVAAHEIGHLMGFVSGVDDVDQFAAALDLTPFRVFNTLDLFRYSAASLAVTGQPATGAVLDLNAGGTPFFSLDSGVTDLGRFSTGRTNGDGRQASHWKDNLGLGLLDPTFAPGEQGILTPLDITAFDAIGWNALSSTAVPEPSSFVLLGLTTVFVGLRRRYRSHRVPLNDRSQRC